MKKVLSLVLVAMLVLSLAPAAIAATVTATPYAFSETSTFKADFEALAGTELPLGDAGPAAKEFKFSLGSLEVNDNITTAKILTVAGKPSVNLVAEYDRTKVSADSLGVGMRIAKGNNVIDKVEIKYLDSVTVGGVKYPIAKADQPAYIQLTLKDELISTSDVDFEVKVYLTKKKVRQSATEITLSGTYKNGVTEVGDGDNYVYLGGDFPVVKSNAYLKSIDIGLDGGITVNTKFFNNKKYYAKGSNAITSDDETVLDEYPDIDQIFSIKSAGLNNSYTTVDLGLSDADLFVYNSNMEYVGTGADKLPYSTKYYVSSVELDVEDAEVEEPVEEPTDPAEEPADPAAEEPAEGLDNPNMGGDDVPENVNDNPGTGC
jgi:hypothetical protein